MDAKRAVSIWGDCPYGDGVRIGGGQRFGFQNHGKEAEEETGAGLWQAPALTHEG